MGAVRERIMKAALAVVWISARQSEQVAKSAGITGRVEPCLGS